MITFQTRPPAGFTLKDKTLLRQWISRILTAEKKTTGELNFVFAGDEEVLAANRQYLNHDTYTDIITFDSVAGSEVSGDILISVDRVRENARTYMVPFTEELHRVMIHGVLHLCGYRDKKKEDVQLMRAKEAAALKQLSKLRGRK
jgi:probable rRNA maturation factor